MENFLLRNKKSGFWKLPEKAFERFILKEEIPEFEERDPALNQKLGPL